jgi:hypothetical protein
MLGLCLANNTKKVSKKQYGHAVDPVDSDTLNATRPNSRKCPAGIGQLVDAEALRKSTTFQPRLSSTSTPGIRLDGKAVALGPK